jgi:hypothetical protein
MTMNDDIETMINRLLNHDPRDDHAAIIMLDQLREFYHGTDYAEDALAIAEIVVCSGSEDEDTAERLLNSFGYLAGMMLDWEINPVTLERARQIRSLALPGIDGEQATSEKESV